MKAAILSLLPLAFAAPATKRAGGPAPLLKPRDVGDNLIPGQYIVKMKEGMQVSSVDDALNLFAGDAEHEWKTGEFKGFAAKLDDVALDAIANHPDVEYIEQDAVVSINTYVTQSSPPWGLGRISHQALSTSQYVYDDSAGTGVCAYVIDTGILTTHNQFGGRATWLANYAGDGSNTDGNGHGTHVAGTIGGTTYGVAKKVSLYAVKVLNASGSGTNSGVISGMNYVASDSQTRSCPKGVVANMSLGGSTSTAVNSAAASMVKAGVFLAVAAGNDGANAANSSPASEPTVCTVGATTSADALASYSNFGAVVDILAPGSNVLSAWIGSNSATNTISGTSMATPHITGLGAYFLALNGAKTPAALCTYFWIPKGVNDILTRSHQQIQTTSTKNKITGVPSSTKNYLAFNGNPSG
ncbi:putative Cuticle-degrading protease [Seiridium cardinale]|uniref:Cuticle-degrading protease n=1 Tax=Seiridium cardinale TaxID=138064 RepID=A0ABR2XNJ8_9PEZI